MADLNGYYRQVLQGLGLPVTPQNLASLSAWQRAEGGWTNNAAAFNPFNTTRGSQYKGINSVGVRAYPNMQVGVQQTIDTLKLPYYKGIRSALASSAPLDAFASAVYSSPWGTKRGIAPGGGTRTLQAVTEPAPARKTVPPEILKMIGLPADPVKALSSLRAALPKGFIPGSGGITYPRLSGPEPTNQTGSTIVQEAYKWLGTPYSWAGGGLKGPSRGVGRGANTVGFDCSGFLQYMWGKVGVKIPRVTYQQWTAGYAVKDPRPGDAVFFRMGKQGPEHVGMYIGNGQFIHAPKTGDVVKISNLSDPYYQRNFVGARRYA